MIGLKIQDLIDIEQFQRLQDRLNEIYSFPSSIIDNDGKILTATAWQDICTLFHRQNPECEKMCIKSDQYIAAHIHEANPAVSYQCPHGLIDNATPIIIEGVHYGNFFTGQFFLEPPDLDFFRSQSKKYGFDEAPYLEAVRKVPIWTREKLNSYLFFIKGLIEVIAGIGLKNLREIETRDRLQENEERFRTIIQAAMDGFWLVDTQGRLREVNAAYCRMSGYTAGELLAMRIADLETVETADNTAAHIRKVMEKGEDRFESRHRRKDGSVFDVEVSVQYHALAGGRLVAFLRDITGRKVMEKALRESENKYRDILENANSIILRMDKSGVITYFNDYAAQFLGFSPGEIIGRNVVGTIVPPIDSAGKDLAAMILDIGVHPEHYKRNENENIRKDGTRVWVAWTNTPVLYDHGQCVEVLAIGNDITERKRVEEALRKSEELLGKAFHTNQDAININRLADGMYVLINEGLTRMLGYTEGEIVGRTSIELNIWKNLEDRQRLLTELGKSGDVKNFEARFRKKDGNFIYGLMSTSRITLDGVPHILNVTKDITDRRQAEEDKAKLEGQLQQAQKMESVGRLAGGVAHDFNNMLGVILGHTEMALAQTDPAHPLHADLVEIHKAASRSADLTRQLLGFARKQTVAPKVLDLNMTVTGMLKMLRRLIGEDIHLNWLPFADLWPVKVDPSQIDQILANLCVNARDAISGVGKMTIETENRTLDEDYCALHAGFVPGNYVILAVSDDGCGMNKETLSHLFEPFFTTKGMGKGTGLGLATVYGIVKQNNGFINVYSEPDQGTTFKIYLPRHAGKTGQLQTKGPAVPARRGRETILLAEDEPAILELTTMMLERQGYTVLAASTPGEAIRLAGEYAGEIHLLMTDVVMPEMNGRDLAKNLLSLYPHLRRLFMSGYTADVIAHHGVLDEGVYFIQKPFSIKGLAAKVREALDQK